MFLRDSPLSIPAPLGYYMPAEWHAHNGTWLAWPKNPLTFPPRILPEVEETFVQMATQLSENEKVNLLADNQEVAEKVRARLHKSGAKDSNVNLHLIPTGCVWIRDYGPTFLLNKRSRTKGCVKWEFNAWGNKYEDLLMDNETGESIAKYAEKEGVRVFHANVVMEGGSIDADGNGKLLTTKQCLLNPNRNPTLNQSQISQVLRDFLDVSDIIWLSSGIEGDDTDGHADDFARFFAKNKVLCNAGESKTDANTKVLEQNESLLRSHSELEVVNLPMPKPLVDEEENRRLPASYANFYIANKKVLMPAFVDKKDKEAVEILSSCFSGREVVPINARALVYGYGGIHCATQQEPSKE